MTGAEWGAVGIVLGLACLPVCRWWIVLCDTREPKYVRLLK